MPFFMNVWFIKINEHAYKFKKNIIHLLKKESNKLWQNQIVSQYLP